MAPVSGSQPEPEVTVSWSTASGTPEAASELLRAEVARLWQVSPAEVRLTRACPQCGSSDHGRPTVLSRPGNRPPFVSLSRAGDVIVVAVSPDCPVGVDVEQLEALRFAGFDDVALHRQETAPTISARAATWVRKESLLKATGDALHVDPRLIRLSDPDQPPALIEWSALRPPTTDVWMYDLHIQGHAACLTVLVDHEPQITLRQVTRAEPLR